MLCASASRAYVCRHVLVTDKYINSILAPERHLCLEKRLWYVHKWHFSSSQVLVALRGICDCTLLCEYWKGAPQTGEFCGGLREDAEQPGLQQTVGEPCQARVGAAPGGSTRHPQIWLGASGRDVPAGQNWQRRRISRVGRELNLGPKSKGWSKVRGHRESSLQRFLLPAFNYLAEVWTQSLHSWLLQQKRDFWTVTEGDWASHLLGSLPNGTAGHCRSAHTTWFSLVMPQFAHSWWQLPDLKLYWALEMLWPGGYRWEVNRPRKT